RRVAGPASSRAGPDVQIGHTTQRHSWKRTALLVALGLLALSAADRAWLASEQWGAVLPGEALVSPAGPPAATRHSTTDSQISRLQDSLRAAPDEAETYVALGSL